LHIHLLQATKKRTLRSSKDTNGGYGTVNDFGRGLTAFLLKYLKRGTMNFPELLPAYVQAILRQQGHKVTYTHNHLDEHAEIVLIQTSIVNFNEEIQWAERIRQQYPQMKIGFIGGMSAGNPHLYTGRGDFIITGETEKALLEGNLSAFEGIVDAGLVEDLDALPFPDWSHIQDQHQGYSLVGNRRGGFFPVSSSRGCPMTCAYYCTYPLIQGAKYRGRSPENVVDELEYLQKKSGMTTVLFRDPIFSLKMERVQQMCDLILARGLEFSWICETHPRFLTPELIQIMARAGCVAVKLGIESGDLEVMKKSKRAAPDLQIQEDVVKLLESHGIQVLAFYIVGYFDDDRTSVMRTIQYAEHLNTYGAQFTIATPYPGTQWHTDLSAQPEIYAFDNNLENYNQYRLVYQHPHLSFGELEQLKSLAYRRYYLRWPYIRKHFLKAGPR
jgi:anaerobic magnesium-protoporphyrin IX monomethyl ester cyclase